MSQITDGTIAFDPDELDWFFNQYGTTEWAVYFPGMDEVTTHDRHYPGDEVKGEPFTEETVRAYLAEFDSRFGPGSPMAREVHEPSYAVALHYGKPAFGSHKHSFGDCVCGAPATAADYEIAVDTPECPDCSNGCGGHAPETYHVDCGENVTDCTCPNRPATVEQDWRDGTTAVYRLNDWITNRPVGSETADAGALDRFASDVAEVLAQLADALELLSARADGTPHIVETTIGLDPLSPDAPHWTVHHPLQCHRLSYGEACEFDAAADRWRLMFPIEVGRYEARIEEYDGVPGAELMLERLDDKAGM